MYVCIGRDLQRVIDANKRLHPIYTMEVVTGVLKGLKALHEKQVYTHTLSHTHTHTHTHTQGS
jgi:hypothetical protein